jgi:riboflavin kinase/FMN adenylyltransferase
MVAVDGTLVKGACSIGLNPTFDGAGRSIEVFMLDYSAQIYDRNIAVYFVERLRDIRKFPNVSELINAIEQDVQHTRMILDTVARDKITPVVEMGLNEIEI